VVVLSIEIIPPTGNVFTVPDIKAERVPKMRYLIRIEISAGTKTLY